MPSIIAPWSCAIICTCDLDVRLVHYLTMSTSTSPKQLYRHLHLHQLLSACTWELNVLLPQILLWTLNSPVAVVPKRIKQYSYNDGLPTGWHWGVRRSAVDHLRQISLVSLWVMLRSTFCFIAGRRSPVNKLGIQLCVHSLAFSDLTFCVFVNCSYNKTKNIIVK